jgi:hypothetical protein
MENRRGSCGSDARDRKIGGVPARERKNEMSRSNRWMIAACFGLVSLGPSGGAVADANGRVSCEIRENGQPASGVISVQRDGKEIATIGCSGKELNVPAGEYVGALRLDGALDGPEQKQPLRVQAGEAVKLKADFSTGTLEVKIASLGKRAAGMAVIKRGPQQLGTLGSGVVAHLSAGVYRVIARYRAQEKDLGEVNIRSGQQLMLEAAFE